MFDCHLRDIRSNWNDTEKTSVGPAQGCHAQIEKWSSIGFDSFIISDLGLLILISKIGNMKPRD